MSGAGKEFIPQSILMYHPIIVISIHHHKIAVLGPAIETSLGGLSFGVG